MAHEGEAAPTCPKCGRVATLSEAGLLWVCDHGAQPASPGEAERLATALDTFATDLDKYQDTYQNECGLMREAAALLRTQAEELTRLRAMETHAKDLLERMVKAALAEVDAATLASSQEGKK